MALIRTLVAAGIKSGKGPFLGLLFLMALTAAALTFALCMYVDLNARETEALVEAGAGDVYAYDLSSRFTDEAARELEGLDEVGEVRTNGALNIPTLLDDGEGEGADKNPPLAVLYKAWGEGASCKLLTPDGTGFADDPQPPGDGEAYVPLPLKASSGLEIGDTVTLEVGARSRTLTVAGFIEDPQMGTSFMELKRYEVALETYEELARAVDEAVAVRGEPVDIYSAGPFAHRLVEVNVFLSDEARSRGAELSDLTRAIVDDTAWGAIAPGVFSSTTLAGYAMMVVVIGAAVMGAFACLLFVVALVICAHTISSSIEEHYADYGMLKAVGLDQRMLAGVLIVEHVGASLAGFALGFALAAAALPLALPFFAPLTGVLASNDAVPVEVFAALAALLAFVAAVVCLRARKLGAISPLVALRAGTEDVSFVSRASRPITGARLNLQLALRSVVSAKRHYVGLAVCAFLLSAFVVLVFGVCGTLGKPDAAYDTFGIWRSDVTVAAVSPDLDFEEVERVIEDVSPIERKWQESFTMVKLGGEIRTFVGLTDTSLVSNTSEGRAPLYDNEVLVGTNLAALMGLEMGDDLAVRGVDGTERSFLVCGTLSGMLNAGYGCVLTFGGLCDLTGSDLYASGVPRQYALADPGKADEARAALEARFGDGIDARPGGLFSGTSDMVELIQSLFVFLNYGMALVAAALVFLTVSLIIGHFFTVERRDLGTYRALGFTCHALRVQFALRFFCVALVGCALGATAATLGGGWLVSKLFSLFGVSQFSLDANPLMVSGLAMGLALVFLVAAYVSARKVKRVDVRELVTE